MLALIATVDRDTESERIVRHSPTTHTFAIGRCCTHILIRLWIHSRIMRSRHGNDTAKVELGVPTARCVVT